MFNGMRLESDSGKEEIRKNSRKETRTDTEKYYVLLLSGNNGGKRRVKEKKGKCY
jgi:hypothetical protein